MNVVLTIVVKDVDPAAELDLIEQAVIRQVDKLAPEHVVELTNTEVEED